jgi:hypothetical protein
MVVPILKADYPRVTHPFATLLPMQASGFSFDLHV